MAWKRKYRCRECGYEAETYEGKGLFGQHITPVSCPDCHTIQNLVVGGVIGDVAPSTNELLFGWPAQTIGIDIKSELFKVLTQIQDEVHRYAITFHRDKRSKHALHSELDDIKGIGPKTKDLLIKKLKSVKQIKLTDLQTLTSVLGVGKATIIYKHLHPGETVTEK